MTDPSSIDWFSVLSFLHARSPPVKAAIIGAIATCISAGVATVVVFLQIGRQARNALQQKRHDEALKLKLEVYQRILAIYAAATDAETNLSAYIRLFHAALSMARSQQDKNLGWSTPTVRFPSLNNKHHESSRRSIDVVLLVEEWGAIDPRLEVFKTAINAVNYEVDRALSHYQDLALYLMPTTKQNAINDQDVFPWQPPPQTQIDELNKRANIALSLLDDRACYLGDFRTEMQNLLVSELFGNKAPIRQPLDRRLKVIELARHEDLNRYFREETDWGRNFQRIQNEVKVQLAQDYIRGPAKPS